MLSFVLASSPGLEPGLQKLTEDQFIGWADARARQGTVLGPLALAGVSHPDLATRWSALARPRRFLR